MAIFTAAKSAESICAYLLGLERQRVQIGGHAEWVARYQLAESKLPSR